jgi:hypothetical protein
MRVIYIYIYIYDTRLCARILGVVSVLRCSCPHPCAVQEGKGICQGPSGSTYTGEWKDGKPHGEGTVLQRGSDGHGDVTWTGKWKDGIRVGETKVDSDDFSFFISYPSMGDKMGASKIKMKKKEVDRKCFGEPPFPRVDLFSFTLQAPPL